MFLLNAKTHKYRDFFRDMKVKKCQKSNVKSTKEADIGLLVFIGLLSPIDLNTINNHFFINLLIYLFFSDFASTI